MARAAALPETAPGWTKLQHERRRRPPSRPSGDPFPGGLTGRAMRAGQESLSGQRRGLRGFLPFVGPAVIASVAYMDPGNFATNIQAGARYGYGLLWVVTLANLIAMLFQALSARLGIVTGQSLAALCRSHFPRPVTLAMWVGSEIAAMATDLAETVGAAIGLSLLLGLPLLTSLGLTMVLTWGLLTLQSRGFRPIELIIAGFVGLIGLCYLIELAIAPPDWRLFAWHAVVPEIRDSGALTLAVGIVGATVMPHAIYLHSALMPGRMPTRNRAEKAESHPPFQHRGADRAELRRPGQPGDGGDGRLDVPRRPSRSGRDRDRLSHTVAADGRVRRTGVHDLTARIRACRVRWSAPWPARPSWRISSASGRRCGCGGC